MPGSFRGRQGRHTGIDVRPDAVRQAREDAGLSLRQLAEPDLTRGAIHLIEQGKARPSLRTLRLIAQRTGKPVSYFLASSPGAPEHRAAADHLERLVSTGDFRATIEYGEHLLGQELGRAVEADVHFCLGRAYVRSGDGQRALPHLACAEELYGLVGDPFRLADALNQIACAYYLIDDQRALAVAYQALDMCERLRPEQPELMVRTLMVVGMILCRIQDWTRAAKVCERALEMVTSAEGIRNIALLNDHLSVTYQRLGRFADALRHARKAAHLYQGSADPSDLFRAEHNFGCILLRQGELAAARPRLERAFELCKERDLPPQARAAAMLALSELYIALGNLDGAATLLEEAVTLAGRSDEATAWRLWGRLHLRRGDYEQADAAFAKAVTLLKSLDLRADVFDVQIEHAEALRDQGRIEEALELWRQAGTSGRLAIQRIQSGGADVVAAHWAR